MRRVILLLVLILLISLAHSFAAVPCKINYQGRLIENNVPVDNTAGIPMIFKLFNTATGTEGEKVVYSGDVPVYNGLFRAVLDLQGVDWTAGEAKYLQVIVDGEPLSPREELSAYPYAINSHLLEGATKEYFLNTSADTQTKQGNLNIGGNLSVGGAQFEHKGYNFLLGTDDGREKGNKQSQRALVHDGNDKLFINYNTDFEGGVKIEPSVYISTNGNVGIGTTSPGSYRLDVEGGKFRATANVYDSGWFAVTKNTNYTLTHNLGTDKLLITAYARDNATSQAKVLYYSFDDEANTRGNPLIKIQGANTIGVRAGVNYAIMYNDGSNDVRLTSAEYRIIVLALE